MQKVIEENGKPEGKTAFGAADSPGRGGAHMLVLVQGSRDRELYGSVVHMALQEPVPYGNIRELLLTLDTIGRQLGLSPSKEGFRTLGGGSGGEFCRTEPEWNRNGEEYDEESRFWSQIRAQKPREFFQLHLAGMQNSSLQGSVRGRLTKGRHVYFRSALELMSMLSAVRLPKAEDRLTMRI